MSVSRTVLFEVFGLDGSAKTGKTVNSDWFAYYKVNGGSTQTITSATELAFGAYTVSISADPTDIVVAWGKYVDGTVTIPLVGIPIRQWDSVGEVAGAVGSVTGAVGSVTGNVGGNVTGTVASVVGNVGGNITGSVASVAGNLGGNVVGTVASVVGSVGGDVQGKILGGGPSSFTGDGVQAASVTGNLGGNVVGTVASVVTKTGYALTSAYDLAKTAAQAGDAMDLINVPNATALSAIGTAVWATGTRTLTSFGTLVADTATAVWSALTSAMTTVGSIGKLLVTNVDATASSIKTQTDLIGTNAADSPAAQTAQAAAGTAATQATAAAASAASADGKLPVDTAARLAHLDEDISAVDATAGDAPTTAEIWGYGDRSLNNGTTRIVSPFQAGSFTVIRGDSYLNADGNERLFTKVSGATWPTDLTGWTITFTCNPTDDLLAADASAVGFTATGAIVTATGDSQAVRVDFTAAQTDTLSVADGGYKYDVQASSGSSRATLETGFMAVMEDQTTG